MSVIEEALRQAHVGIRSNAQSASAAPAAPAPMPNPSSVATPPTKASRPVGLVRSAGVGVGLFAGIVLWMVWNRPAQPVAPPVVALPESVPRVPERSERLFARPVRPAWQLSGVVEGPGESLAIINGHVVRVGETIDGAVVLDVTQDSARLRWRDQDVVLRTQP